MNTGKCPKCEKLIQSVVIENISMTVGFQPAWVGVTYLCPLCRTILGTGIDPVALKKDTVTEILKALTGR